MQLGCDSHIPDGLLAAIALLSEKPRLGVPSRNPAPNLGLDERNCTALLCLQFACSKTMSGPVEDPYNGSYDLMNPQSFNRYMYVNGNPLAYTDPTGLANGWLTGVGGSLCSNANGTFGGSSFSGINISTPIGNINPCNPVASLIAIGVQATINGIWGTAIKVGQIAPFVAAAVTIACSIDNFDSTACGGSSGWASVAFGNGSVASKVVGDTTAVIGATLCAIGGPTSPGCIGYAIYTLANDLFGIFWDLFGPPQFTGSLLPRPSDLGGLGTSPIGIPNQNLSIRGILGQSSRGAVKSPGMNIP